MTSMTLRYGEDSATGLPRLEDPSGVLRPADLAVLGDEIGRQFERLAGGPDEQLLALDDLSRPELPRHFRVTVREREKRCPTLLLESVPAPEADAPFPRGRWQGQFLAEVAELLAGAAEGSGRSALDFVLTDLRLLLRNDPARFTLLLLAGYLHVGDTLSLKHGEPSNNRYAEAAGVLSRLLAHALPPGTLDPLLNVTL